MLLRSSPTVCTSMRRSAAAGHSREILSRLGQGGRLFAFDQDSEVPAGEIDDPRFTFVGENFRYMSRYLRFYRVEAVDGILADLGVSFPPVRYGWARLFHPLRRPAGHADEPFGRADGSSGGQ